jgi:alanine racemase
MIDQFRRVWAEVDLDAAKNNISEIRRITNEDAKIMAAVKADSYGHGAVELAKVFLKNGADALAVAIIDEAEQLRLEGLDCPILILGLTHVSSIKNVVKYDVTQAVFTYEMAKLISDEALSQGKIAKIHIKVDTGMGRIGFLPSEESIEVIERISKLPNILLEGIFTHFSVSDERDKEFTNKQFNIFINIIKELELKGINIPIKHCANSAAIIDCPEMHLNMVRPGIILYGLYPSNEVNKNKINLIPLMKLKASIVHIKQVKKDTSISYGRTFITQKDSTIATVPIGYADGYSRLLSSKGKVIIKDELAPVIGRVCMDQMMIDITGIEDVKVGDEVIVIGNSENKKVSFEEVADIVGTINYEIVCMISKRIPRVYIKNNKIFKVINYLL